MDNFNSSKASSNDDTDKPIPFDDIDINNEDVSHSPLNLGTSATTQPPKGNAPAQFTRPAVKEQAKKNSSPDRITGVKTFFAKLHPGSMEFLDQQITSWLNNNPGITVKLTNTITGEVQAKKTEPNIIITVWY